MNDKVTPINKSIEKWEIKKKRGTLTEAIEDSSIDVGLIVAGWQYLQYPEQVSLELSRVIKSDSLLIISFTNRAFWTKAPNIWTYSSEAQRIEYVKSVLSSNGWRIEKILIEKTED